MGRAWIFILLATLFFSTMEIALKSIAGNFSALQVNLTRFLIGGLALVPLALRDLGRGTARPGARDIGLLALLGLLCIVVSMGLYQLALEAAPASVVGVIFCCNPAFVLGFAHLILKSPIQRSQVAAIVLALLGIAAILWPHMGVLDGRAMLFSVLAPAVFAFYAVLSTPLCHRSSVVVVTCATFLFGVLELAVIVGLASIPSVAELARAAGLGFVADVDLLAGYTPRTLLGMLYVGVGVTGMGFACYFMAAEVASPFAASLVFFFKPVLAPILAFLVLGENIPLSMRLGIALILSGSLCLLLARLRELRMVRSILHLRKVWQHRRWREEYRARHFDHNHFDHDLVPREESMDTGSMDVGAGAAGAVDGRGQAGRARDGDRDC